MKKLCLFFLFLTATVIQPLFAQENPNVIFILADDLGWGDLACYGHPYAKTPNIDKLADSGIRFKRAYMAGPWCAPSRFALMTGQYPAREFNNTRNMDPKKDVTLTSHLKGAGYRTAHFGKWHLNRGLEYAKSPGEFGIDVHFTTNGNGNGKTWTREERAQEYWRANTTDAYIDMAMNFIDNTTKNGKRQPFFINLWVYPTHSYIHPTPEQLKVYKNLKVDLSDFSNYQQEFLKFVAKHGYLDEAMQAYCADITAMDKAIGRLMAYLEKNGLTENTLIVFSSDNGPGPLTSQIKNESVVERYKERPDLLNSVGSADRYKERKISLHDGGIRVPFIVSWPGKIPINKVDATSIIHGTDFMPTISSLCDVPLPNTDFDGKNRKDAFMGQTMDRETPVFWSQASRVALLQGNWKCLLDRNDDLELYDIQQDPIESNNVASDHPGVTALLKTALQKWRDEMQAP